MNEYFLSLKSKEAIQAKNRELKALVRAMNPQPEWPLDGLIIWTDCGNGIFTAHDGRYLCADGSIGEWHCPFGSPGDILHLKETWIQTGGAFFEAYKVDGCEENGIIMSPVTLERRIIRHHYRVVESRAMQAKKLTDHDIYLTGIRGDFYPDANACDPHSAWIYFMETYHIDSPDQWIWFVKVESVK